VNLCPTPTNCTGSLFGSDDGGHTWTLRSDHLVGDLTVHTPGELTLHSAVSALAPKGTSPDNTERVATSHDGGRTWTRVTTQVDSTPLPVVPNGGWLGCGGPSPARCLYAYTAGGAHRAPLANQPSLVHMHPMDLPASAGLWVAGEDPVSYRVGVAVSKDRGHTWSPVWTPGAGERDFPDCPNGEDAEVTSLDGMTAYAVVTCNSAGPDVVNRVLVYRTGDGGITWHRVDPGGTFPNAVGWLSYIAADGTHVVDAARTNPAQWWSSRDAGNTYQHATQLNGLPAEPTEAVSVLAPGLYLAFDRTAVYLSNNGIDWTRAAVSVPAR
jgi:photosystem II stability/assembly factor-like uncharacterized protein